MKEVYQNSGEAYWIVRHWLDREQAQNLSYDEAHFWLDAIYYLKKLGSSEKLLAYLAEKDVYEQLSLVDFIRINLENVPHDVLIHTVWRFYGQEGIIQILRKGHPQLPKFAEEALGELVPYLMPEERHLLCQEILPLLSIASPPELLELALVLGANSRVITDIVQSWPDGSAEPLDRASYENNNRISLIIELRDPKLISRELRRLKAFPIRKDDAVTIIAAAEFECLDFIAECSCNQGDSYTARSLVRVLQQTESPETAIALAIAATNPDTAVLAHEWWIQHPYFAIQGLSLLVYESSNRGKMARFWLHFLKSQNGSAFFERALQGVPPDIAQQVRETILSESSNLESLAGATISECLESLIKSDISPNVSAVEFPERRINTKSLTVPTPLASSFVQLPVQPSALFNFHTAASQLPSLYVNQRWEIQKQKFIFPMSVKEAHFWLEAYHTIKQTSDELLTPHILEDKLSKITLGSSYDISLLNGYHASHFMIPAWVLFGVDGLLRSCNSSYDIRYSFARNLLPYLSTSERDAIADKIFQTIRENNNSWQVPNLIELLGELPVSQKLFETAILEAENQKWDIRNDNPMLRLLLRLSNPSRIVEIATIKHIYPNTEDEILQWLAVTGFHGCDIAREKAGELSREARARVLSSIESPEVAPDIAALRKFPTSQVIAETWLDSLPSFAIEGLIPLLVESDPKRVELAADCLCELDRKGYRWLITKHKDNSELPVQVAIERLVLTVRSEKAQRTSLKDRELVEHLPPILLNRGLDTYRLTPEQTISLLAMLKQVSLSEPSPTLEIVRQNADRTSLDRFLWILFQSWLHGGMPNRDRWKYEALGHLGGDFIARQLRPLIHSWPVGEKTQPYVKMGLECLRAIGSEVALLQMYEILSATRNGPFRNRVRSYIDYLQSAHNLASQEDIDRFTPDANLDQSGSYTFDLGTRQFTLKLASDLIPVFKDQSGKLRTELPRAGKYDSRVKTATATKTWEWMEQEITIARGRAKHLKRAQTERRRWNPTGFYQHLVRHSLLGLMVQGIIWATYDADGTLLQTFRVTEHRTLADDKDASWSLPSDTLFIGIVHSDDLNIEQQELWMERLADYEIFPPFIQFQTICEGP